MMDVCEQCRAKYLATKELSHGLCHGCHIDLIEEDRLQRLEDLETYWGIVSAGLSGLFERGEV